MKVTSPCLYLTRRMPWHGCGRGSRVAKRCSKGNVDVRAHEGDRMRGEHRECYEATEFPHTCRREDLLFDEENGRR